VSISTLFFVGAAACQSLVAWRFSSPRFGAAQWVTRRLGVRPAEAVGFVAVTVLFDLAIVAAALSGGSLRSTIGFAAICLFLLAFVSFPLLLGLGHRRLDLQDRHDVQQSAV
jgi:hypothetical protein